MEFQFNLCDYLDIVTNKLIITIKIVNLNKIKEKEKNNKMKNKLFKILLIALTL